MNKDYLDKVDLIKKGEVVVIPTDTIYGIVGLATNKDVVERIYSLKKRNSKKPLIVLISSVSNLKIFKIKTTSEQEEVLKNVWPGKVSVLFECLGDEFYYLHRGTNKIAFRLPKKEELVNFIKKSGPIVAPSANTENNAPAKNIKEAKKYFEDNVFYVDGGEVKGSPSKIIDITGNCVKIIRK